MKDDVGIDADVDLELLGSFLSLLFSFTKTFLNSRDVTISFSPFLSEKKSFEKRKAQEALERPSLPGFSLKGLNLPPIPLPNSYR